MFLLSVPKFLWLPGAIVVEEGGGKIIPSLPMWCDSAEIVICTPKLVLLFLGVTAFEKPSTRLQPARLQDQLPWCEKAGGFVRQDAGHRCRLREMVNASSPITDQSPDPLIPGM